LIAGPCPVFFFFKNKKAFQFFFYSNLIQAWGKNEDLDQNDDALVL